MTGGEIPWTANALWSGTQRHLLLESRVLFVTLKLPGAKRKQNQWDHGTVILTTEILGPTHYCSGLCAGFYAGAKGVKRWCKILLLTSRPQSNNAVEHMLNFKHLSNPRAVQVLKGRPSLPALLNRGPALV